MTTYHLRSPSGRVLTLYAASIYHAIQQAIWQEGYRWEVWEYLALNKGKA